MWCLVWQWRLVWCLAGRQRFWMWQPALGVAAALVLAASLVVETRPCDDVSLWAGQEAAASLAVPVSCWLATAHSCASLRRTPLHALVCLLTVLCARLSHPVPSPSLPVAEGPCAPPFPASSLAFMLVLLLAPMHTSQKQTENRQCHRAYQPGTTSAAILQALTLNTTPVSACTRMRRLTVAPSCCSGPRHSSAASKGLCSQACAVLFSPTTASGNKFTTARAQAGWRNVVHTALQCVLAGRCCLVHPHRGEFTVQNSKYRYLGEHFSL